MSDLKSRIERALDDIRIFMRADGGDVQIIKIEKNQLFIKFIGACVKCPMSSITLTMGIEETIKDKIPEIEKIVVLD